jgi:hypothetical protein
MAGLEGTIKEFGVADILQLICQQQKTGVLIVESKGGKAEIFLEEGNISAGRVFTRPPGDALGSLLVKAKLISPAQLQAALDAQKETCEQFGEILLRQGVISRVDLERAIQVQIYETFYVIFQWKEGSYQFNPKDVKDKSPLYQLINIQSILLDLLRMIDEWPDVKRFIPSFDIVFQPVPGSFPAELDSDGLLVYNLIDGARTVQQIIDEALMGTFNTCKILSELLQAGYIAKAAAAAPTPAGPLIAALTKNFGAAVHYTALALVLAPVLLLPTTFPGNILPLLNVKQVQQSSLAEYQTQMKLLRIENALEVYTILKGRYPGNLHELVAGDFLRADDLKVTQGKTISYAPENESYRLAVAAAGDTQ